jgi:tRNA uridine 5-carbamoylmethylation protein Kti12
MNSVNLYPAPHPQTSWSFHDDEAVLLLAETNEVQVLNSVAASIFRLSVEGQRTLAQIASELTDEYNVDLDQALADVDAFVRDLVDNQVLVIDESPREDR